MTKTTGVHETECRREKKKKKKEFTRERRIWWSVVSKAAERSNKRRTEMLSLSRAERISFTIRNKTVSVLCPAR